MFPAMTEDMDRLAEGVDALQSFRDDTLLATSVCPASGSMWLVPRPERFYAKHPEVEIRVDGTDRLVNVALGKAVPKIKAFRDWFLGEAQWPNGLP